MLAEIIVILILLLIVASLFSGMFYMLRDRGQSTRAVKALTLRIALSLFLFFLLMLGYWTGILHPNALLPR